MEPVFVVISAYFDDSHTDQRLWVVAGLAGYANQWEMFERLWRGVLATHGVPHFHMKEMAGTSGAFAKWHPPEKHQQEVTAYLKDAVAAIRDPYLHMFGAVVVLPDLKRFNTEKGLDLKPYSLAAYGCVTQLALHYRDLPVTAVFDRAEDIDGKLAAARRYAESDLNPALTRQVSSLPLGEELTSRTVAPLQAADLVAWEQRRAHMSLEKTRDEHFDEFRVWSRLNREYPLQRKSVDALIEAGLSVNLLVWDYHELSRTHKARGESWERRGE